MSCRTRNMEKLIYYCADITPRNMKHQNQKELENSYKKMIKYNNRLLGLSGSKNEDDEIQIVENTFFKMFCYEEFQDEIFHTGYLQHYENILKRDGFDLCSEGEKKKLPKEKGIKLKEMFEIFEDEKFDQFVEKYFSVETEEDINYILNHYKVMMDRTELLGISEKEDAIKYKTLIMDDYVLKNCFSLMNLLKTSNYIKEKLTKKKENTFKIKLLSSTINKIALLEEFEKHYKINRFQMDFKDVDVSNEISEKFKDLYIELFPKRNAKSFKTKDNLLKIYVNIIRNICGDIKLIYRKQTNKEEGKKKYGFELNAQILREVVELVKLKNGALKNYDTELIEKLTGIKPDAKALKIGDNDDEDMYNSYIFRKNNYKI